MKLALLKILEIILPQFIKSIFGKKEKKRLIIGLENHDVFSTLDRVRNEVANLKFYTHGEYDKVKTRMCYDFTKHKSIKCSARMLEIVRTKDIDTMDRDKLKKLILLEQGDMHREYIKAIRIEWDLKGVSPQDVDYVIHLFEKFRYDVIVSFEHRINSIFGSTYNKDNFALMLAVVEMRAMGLDLLPADMSTMFGSLDCKFKDMNDLR